MKSKAYNTCKKFFSVLLVLCMLASLSPIQSRAESKDATAFGKVFKDYEGSSSFLTGAYETSSIQIDQFNIDDLNAVSLTGSISYDGQSFDLQVDGTLYKGMLDTKDAVYGNTVDASGNFEVLYLAIKENPKASDLIVDNSLTNSNILFLYTINKQNNDLILFELNLGKIYDAPIAYSVPAKTEDPLIEQWWIKVVTPVIGDGEMSDSRELESSNKSTAAAVSTTVVTQPKTFTYVLNTDNTYKYYIKLTARAATTSHGGVAQVTDTASLTVEDQYVEHNGVYLGDFYHLLVTNPSVRVAVGTVVGLKVHGINSDWIQQANWSMNTTYTTGGLQFSLKELSWSAGIGDFVLTERKTVQYNNYLFNTTSSTYKGVEFNYPYAIQQKGQNCNLGILKNNQGSSNQTRTVQYIWSFNIAYVNTVTPVLTNQTINLFAYYVN
ncbi:MAG: hypothetical protein K0R05_4739 [Anaerocolumna sp.]|nr:hypothetical protein [Anaerocolumna sp.]